MSAKTPPKVELTIPILQDMELAATNTAEVVAKHMGLSEEKTAEISMALIEATINAFEHSESKSSNVEIHFVIQGDTLVIKVSDHGKGFDKSTVEIPNIENKLNNDERKRGWGLQLITALMDTVESVSYTHLTLPTKA